MEVIYKTRGFNTDFFKNICKHALNKGLIDKPFFYLDKIKYDDHGNHIIIRIENDSMNEIIRNEFKERNVEPQEVNPNFDPLEFVNFCKHNMASPKMIHYSGYPHVDLVIVACSEWICQHYIDLLMHDGLLSIPVSKDVYLKITSLLNSYENDIFETFRRFIEEE